MSRKQNQQDDTSVSEPVSASVTSGDTSARTSDCGVDLSLKVNAGQKMDEILKDSVRRLTMYYLRRSGLIDEDGRLG